MSKNNEIPYTGFLPRKNFSTPQFMVMVLAVLLLTFLILSIFF